MQLIYWLTIQDIYFFIVTSVLLSQKMLSTKYMDSKLVRHTAMQVPFQFPFQVLSAWVCASNASTASFTKQVATSHIEKIQYFILT